MDLTKEEYIRGLIGSLKDVKYIMPEDIPNIDLYMDQVTTFMDKHLKSSKRYSEDKLLTKTMINNYTKNELLPPPNKKKYSKEHMFLLIFIYYFKNVLSISDIQSIFNPLTERYYGNMSKVKLEDIYEEIFRIEKEQTDALTKDMIRKMSKAKDSFADISNKEDNDFLTMFSFICMLCFDVYMKKQIIEKMIDHHMIGEGFLNSKEGQDFARNIERMAEVKKANGNTGKKVDAKTAPMKKVDGRTAPTKKVEGKATATKRVASKPTPQKKPSANTASTAKKSEVKATKTATVASGKASNGKAVDIETE